TVAVRDGVVQAEDALLLDGRPGLRGEPLAQLPTFGCQRRLAGEGAARTVEQRRQVERRRASGRRLLAPQQFAATDSFCERTQAEGREQLPYLARDVTKVRLDLLRGRSELRAQLRSLRGDSDGAGIEVTGPHHQAAFGEEQRRAERDLVRTEQRCEQDVTAGLQPAVRTQTHSPAQAALDEDALCLCEPELPGRPGMLDRGQWACPGAAVGACDVDD